MGEAIAKAAIDYLFENSKANKYQVGFFGGEPLINFDLVKFAVKYANDKAHQYRKQIEYYIATNGTLLSKDVADFIKNNNIQISISIDGGERIHNAARKFANGTGSFNIVMDNVQRFFGKDIRIRGTLTHRNPNVKSLYDDLRELGFTNIAFRPVTTLKPGWKLTEDDWILVRQSYTEMIESWLDDFERNKYFLITGPFAFAAPIFSGGKKYYGCSAGRAYIVVSPNGDFYPCHRLVGMEKFKIGNISEGINEKVVKTIVPGNVDERDSCKRCWARYLCGGGCFHESITFNGNLEPFTPICDLFKLIAKYGIYIGYMFKDEVEEYYQTSKRFER